MILRGSLVGNVSCQTSKQTQLLSHSFSISRLIFPLALQSSCNLLSSYFSKKLCFRLSLKPCIFYLGTFMKFCKILLRVQVFILKFKILYWYSKFYIDSQKFLLTCEVNDLYSTKHNFMKFGNIRKSFDLTLLLVFRIWSFSFFILHWFHLRPEFHKPKQVLLLLMTL